MQELIEKRVGGQARKSVKRVDRSIMPEGQTAARIDEDVEAEGPTIESEGLDPYFCD
jgi:hypothetical protein